MMDMIRYANARAHAPAAAMQRIVFVVDPEGFIRLYLPGAETVIVPAGGGVEITGLFDRVTRTASEG